MNQFIVNVNQKQQQNSQIRPLKQNNNQSYLLNKTNCSKNLSFKGHPVQPSEIKKFWNNFRRGFELNRYYLSPGSLKEIYNDPKAFLYRFIKDLELIETSRTKLGKIMLQSRKNGKQLPATVTKISHTDGRDRFYVDRLGLRLGQVDITKKVKDDKNTDVYINYITNVVGRKKYKGLEKHLLQAVLEDSIEGGRLPDVTAFPDEIGKNKFSRSVLYKIMGAETEPFAYRDKAGKLKMSEIIRVPSETIRKQVDLLLKKKNYIRPETEQNIHKLKQNQGWN